jgi:hypothetical protein
MMAAELVAEVRARITKVQNEDARLGLMASYLLAARASEIVGVASASDTTTPYGPRGTDVSEAMWQEGERQEPAAVFRLRTAKRGGFERFTALPLNPKYEPWSQRLLEHFKSKGSDLVFPFTRQTLHSYASEAFSGLTYDIEPQRIEGEKVARHKRDAAVHFLRHIRASELGWFYGFNPADLASYCGWSLKNAGYSSVMARYVQLAWQSYFPKLLKPR